MPATAADNPAFLHYAALVSARDAGDDAAFAALRAMTTDQFAALLAEEEEEDPATFAAPGPPPRPGLRWKDETHRWVHPETGGEYHPDGTPHESAPASPPPAGAAAEKGSPAAAEKTADAPPG